MVTVEPSRMPGVACWRDEQQYRLAADAPTKARHRALHLKSEIYDRADGYAGGAFR